MIKGVVSVVVRTGDLHRPATAVPVQVPDHVLQRADLQVAQQDPLPRLDTGGGVDLTRDDHQARQRRAAMLTPLAEMFQTSPTCDPAPASRRQTVPRVG